MATYIKVGEEALTSCKKTVPSTSGEMQSAEEDLTSSLNIGLARCGPIFNAEVNTAQEDLNTGKSDNGPSETEARPSTRQVDHEGVGEESCRRAIPDKSLVHDFIGQADAVN